MTDVDTASVILLDTSQSMATPVAGGQRRVDVLATILRNVATDAPGTRLVAFSSTVTELEPGRPLPEPDGGTALHLALEYLLASRPPQVVIISDGEPDSREAAIAAARALSCVITTYYCGDETNREAIAFLRTLALCSRGGVGRALRDDLRQPQKLAGELKRLLLTGPAR